MTREIKIFQSVFLEWNPTAPLPHFDIRHYPYTTLSHTIRLRGSTLKVRLSHLFKGAPRSVIRATAQILFAKLYQNRAPREALNSYHHFVEVNQHKFRVLLSARLSSAPALRPPRGRHQDLDKVFNRLNHRYFHHQLPKPGLHWSRRSGQSKLGEYQNLRHAIVINRRFDSDSVPAFVLEYLMFHEMLHLKHSAEIRNGRRVVHTSAFRKEEKQFEYFAAAKEWIRKRTQQPMWREPARDF